MLMLTSAGCHRPAPAPRVPAPARVDAAQPGLQIPRAIRPPVLEQHDDEALWQHAVTTGPWLEPNSHAPARPYSQARLLWDERHLYLSLYAADQNIVTSGAQPDRFVVHIQPDGPHAPVFAIDIAPTGTVTDLRVVDGAPDGAWHSGAQVAMDMDGTLNDANGEDDEEWVAFVALPWRQMGMQPAAGTRVRVQFERCDVPKDGVKRCGQWAQTVVLAGSPATPAER